MQNLSIFTSQLLFASLFFITSQTVIAETIEFNSGDKQVNLVELYTSQGCSSCPPADVWMSGLKDEPGLWEEFVPIAYHVDYWDYLGWKDTFSKKEFSHRQRLHHAQGHVNVVYTPGFFRNGREWRGVLGQQAPSAETKAIGKINASLNERLLKVNFESSAKVKNTQLNIAILGFDYKTPIKSGENSNRLLGEDFVVLQQFSATSPDNTWQLELAKPNGPPANRYGLAIWVSEDKDLTPLQATGGWLPKNYF